MRALVLSAFALSTALSAQTLTDQYIELTVSDTPAMVPTGYVYELSAIVEEPAYDENADYDKLFREQQEKQLKALARLEKDVMGMGYSVERFTDGQDPYTLGGDAVEASAPSLRVMVKDQVELKRLVDSLRERKDVAGHLVEVKYDRTKDAQGELLTRLYRTAEERSRALATLGGRKLGKLLLVSTSGDEEFTFADFMRIMEKERGSDDWMERYGAAMPQRMTFRFALID
jgi:hypothetical protein